MLRSWVNQEGVTLTELIAAVVVLGIVVFPITNIGTTIWKQYAVNKATNEATLVAEQHLDEARGVLEQGNALPPDQQQGVADDHLSWQIETKPHAMKGLDDGQLLDVTITVQRANLMTAQTTPLVTLSTIVRKKG